MRSQLEQNLGKNFGRRQRGSIAILAAISISVVIISLASIDIGNQFWQQRNIQRIADAAALAGSQRLGEGCFEATKAAINIKDQYASSITTFEVKCGNWSPDQAGNPGKLGGSGLSGNPTDHFSSPSTSSQNSVKINAGLTFSNWFSISSNGTSSVAAEAIGYNEPIAGFSLGTGVAGVDGGIVNTLLSGLLGVKLDVASYSGIANASLNIRNLAISTSAGTVEKLLSTQVTTQELIVAMINALGSNAAAVAVLTKISDVGASAPTSVLSSVKLKVSDILKIDSPTMDGAASAEVNAFEMLLVAAQIANGTNAVKIASGIQLGALAKVDLDLLIVEPPKIAIGPAGKRGGEWITEAKSASVRLFIESSILDTSKLPGLSPLLTIKALSLPISLQAAPGHAWLSSISCSMPVVNSVVTIGVAPGLAKACIAEGAGTTQVCDKPATISSVEVLPLLGLPLNYKIKLKTPLEAITPQHQATTLTFDGIIGNGNDIRSTATSVNTVLSNTLRSVLINPQLEACLLSICTPLTGALSGVTSSLNDAIIQPLIGNASTPGLLTQVIQPLLNLLGVQLGYSDVHHQSLSCKNSELVF